MPDRKNPLSEAFGIDNDELPTPEPLKEASPEVREDLLPEEIEPGVIKLGDNEYVKDGDQLIHVDTSLTFAMRITALEKHRLQRFANENRMTMSEVIREAVRQMMD